MPSEVAMKQITTIRRLSIAILYFFLAIILNIFLNKAFCKIVKHVRFDFLIFFKSEIDFCSS